MNEAISSHPAESRELAFTRDIALPSERLFKASTDPKLLKQWFAPKPSATPVAELDVHPDGSSQIVMRSPACQKFPNQGVYLEVVPNQRLVFTDASTKASGGPSEHPFMTAVITFEDLGGCRTRYTARVLHWTAADRKKHEAMGFHAGCNQCLDQLSEVIHHN